jgi:short-subunit dehydrogenase
VRKWEYRDRWALVTGASAGLGQVMAEALARRGSHLVLTARRADRLNALATRLSDRYGIRTAVVSADLGARGEASRLWEEATTGRDIDLLFNNAGFGARGRFHELPLDRQLAMVELNCSALLELAHLALAHMRPRGHGGIINVASIAAFQPVPLLATYAASKAFVLSLSEALWAENHEHGIRVLALCPGRTPTEFQEVAGTGSVEGAFGFRTPIQVIESGLRAFEAGRSYDVPGGENLAATWLSRAAPRSFVTRTMKRLVRRVYPEG